MKSAQSEQWSAVAQRSYAAAGGVSSVFDSAPPLTNRLYYPLFAVFKPCLRILHLLDCTLILLHEDPHILVVDKDAGEHSQPPAQASGEPSVLERCQTDFGEDIRLIHRLDRDTSGLLVLARTREAARALGFALRTREITRVYRARIGVLLPLGASGTISDPLKWAGGRTWVDPTGAPAITHWSVVAHRGRASELDVRLETGRMHQIRVHLASRLGPILGDRKYRGESRDRLYLRAIQLSFKHPHTGEDMRFRVKGFPDSPA